LLATLDDRDCAYVYDLGIVTRQAEALLAMPSVARVFYALKANPHRAILRAVAAAGLGFECVSRAEIEHVQDSVPGIAAEQLLFTPNFAPSHEYQWALERGLRVTVDNLYVLRTWGGLFEGRDILLRLDTGHAQGHHDKVRTAGRHSKFGVPPAEFPELKDAADRAGANVVGLHAHGGSGSFEIDGWLQSASVLATVATDFPQATALNLGGGLGVPERAGQAAMDLTAFDAALGAFHRGHPEFELWLEPGRFLVAAAGVLLARVTQTKGKGRPGRNAISISSPSSACAFSVRERSATSPARRPARRAACTSRCSGGRFATVWATSASASCAAVGMRKRSTATV
jgi:diaminopimelate decarboxylase/aspartate kinase